jgi:hypothetical protein
MMFDYSSSPDAGENQCWHSGNRWQWMWQYDCMRHSVLSPMIDLQKYDDDWHTDGPRPRRSDVSHWESFPTRIWNEIRFWTVAKSQWMLVSAGGVAIASNWSLDFFYTSVAFRLVVLLLNPLGSGRMWSTCNNNKTSVFRRMRLWKGAKCDSIGRQDDKAGNGYDMTRDVDQCGGPGDGELNEGSPAMIIGSAIQTSHIFRCKTRRSQALQTSSEV